MGWIVKGTYPRAKQPLRRAPRIWASYYKNRPALKAAGFTEKQLVNIALSFPDSFHGTNYVADDADERAPSILAPSKGLLNEYHGGMSWKDYAKRYRAEVLDKLDPLKVYNDLTCSGEDVVMMCHEDLVSPGKEHCHRQLVGAWLMQNVPGLLVLEWQGEPATMKLFSFSDYEERQKMTETEKRNYLIGGDKGQLEDPEFDEDGEDDPSAQGENYIMQKQRQYRTSKDVKHESVGVNDGSSSSFTRDEHKAPEKEDGLDAPVKVVKLTETQRMLVGDYYSLDRQFYKYRRPGEKILMVCGSRIFNDSKLMYQTLNAVVQAGGYTEIVCGYDPVEKTPKGADQLAYEYAVMKRLKVTMIPAPWKSRPKRADGTKPMDAGYRRNKWLVAYCHGGVCFYGGMKTSGTEDDEKLLREANKLVTVKGL